MMQTLQRTYLLVITIFLCSITYATNHYVDKNATGSNNGTSWANAWQSFSAINWSSVNPGDIVYISGGTDSTVYYEQLNMANVDASAGHPITVRNSWDAGHNGRVIIEASGTYCIYIGSPSDSKYITIYGLEVRGGTKNIYIQYRANDITIDSCLVTDWHTFGLQTEENSGNSAEHIRNITIQNCDFIGATDYGQDAIIFKQSSNHILRNNFIHLRRWTASNGDADGMFAMESENFLITNNIVICDSNMQGQDYIIRASSDNGYNTDSVIVYNNFFYYGGVYNSSSWPDCTNLFLRYNPPDGDAPPTFVANNTIVVRGKSTFAVHTEIPATMINNIIVQFYSTGASGGSWKACFRGNQTIDSIRHNLIWQEPGVSSNLFQGSFSGHSITNWSQWVSYGGTGVNSDPLFVVDLNTIHGSAQANINGEIKENSPARNQGEDIQAYIEYLGLPWVGMGERVAGRLGVTPGTHARDSFPDIGAYEYTSGGGGGNNPPYPPSNPSPANGALNQPVNLTLTWSCTDPDGDPLTYDVYFGTNNNPPLVSGNQSSTSYNPGQLDSNTIYYWKIVAKDNQGATTSGPVWHFSTEATGGGDVTPPELIGVQTVESDQVVLDFSEPLAESQVNNLSNYIISEQIQVLNAELSANQQRISLTTDQHVINHIYTIEIHNLTDLAGNVISPQANSMFYKKLDLGYSGYLEHLIENVSASATTDTNTSPQKTLDGLVSGDPDPNSRWAAEIMPQWIQYDLGSTVDINLIAISFYNWNYGRIYQYSIQISNDENNWNEIVSNASSSSQEWTINEFSPILSSRYVRIICESNNQANWAGLWEARIFEPASPTSVENEPKNYALEQNYPNPFNPSTVISYQIVAGSNVTLKVYDVLGNEVQTLVNEFKPAGEYKIEFYATNLPSGVYFYKLQAGSYIETKKMVLMK